MTTDRGLCRSQFRSRKLRLFKLMRCIVSINRTFWWSCILFEYFNIFGWLTWLVILFHILTHIRSLVRILRQYLNIAILRVLPIERVWPVDLSLLSIIIELFGIRLRLRIIFWLFRIFLFMWVSLVFWRVLRSRPSLTAIILILSLPHLALSPFSIVYNSVIAGLIS